MWSYNPRSVTLAWHVTNNSVLSSMSSWSRFHTTPSVACCDTFPYPCCCMLWSTSTHAFVKHRTDQCCSVFHLSWYRSPWLGPSVCCMPDVLVIFLIYPGFYLCIAYMRDVLNWLPVSKYIANTSAALLYIGASLMVPRPTCAISVDRFLGLSLYGSRGSLCSVKMSLG